MAATLDTQIPPQDDLSHDTLMGLQELDQELDSHLGIFESSNLGRDSTPSAMSTSFDESITTSEQPSNTIIVESPDNGYSSRYHSDPVPRARVTGTKSVFNNIPQYVFFLCYDFSFIQEPD